MSERDDWQDRFNPSPDWMRGVSEDVYKKLVQQVFDKDAEIERLRAETKRLRAALIECEAAMILSKMRPPPVATDRESAGD
jgi:hypothetical protein